MTNVTNNKTAKTFNYSLTVNGTNELCCDEQHTFFWPNSTKEQLINAVAIIENIFNETDDIGAICENYPNWEPFAEKFSSKRRHDITKDDLYCLLWHIEKVILNFKPNYVKNIIWGE